MLFGRGFGPFLLGHRCQALELVDVQSQAFGHPTAIIRIGLVKHGGLSQLDAFWGPTQVIHDIADEMATIRRGQSGQGSLPCSTLLQSRAGTSPGSPHIRRLPPRPGVGSSNRR